MHKHMHVHTCTHMDTCMHAYIHTLMCTHTDTNTARFFMERVTPPIPRLLV